MLAPDSTLQDGRYSIVRTLGAGGMGAVYLARDRNLSGLMVAVKENFDTSQAAQDQFHREAMTLARLRHPNLPQVSDHFIESSGCQYLVMDYVEGKDLTQVLDERGLLPEAEVLGWISQVFDALHYMHSWSDTGNSRTTPIIHRDIKPGNIKLTSSGQVVLVDFGIVKVQTDAFSGTAVRAASSGYSPIEQYTGGTTVRSDIYATGATLYHLLTGLIPPASPDIAAGTPLLSPRKLNPAISATTEAVILQAMRIPAGERFQSILEMRQALAGAMSQVLCPNCGSPNKAGAHFCIHCGHALLSTAPGAPSFLRVALFCILGALIGSGLAYLASWLGIGFSNRMLTTALDAGALTVIAISAIGGALIGRRARVAEPGFATRFLIMLALVFTLESACVLLAQSSLLNSLPGPRALILAGLASISGAIVGTALTSQVRTPVAPAHQETLYARKP
jgi:serine/threonine-protein kinase